MKPKQTDFEKVVCDDFIPGVIVDIERDENHKTVYQGTEKIKDCVRIMIDFEGYESIKSSGWMTFSYSDKAGLFKRYILPLVERATPYMDFDITRLIGMKIKAMWAEKQGSNGNMYQFIEVVRPLDKKTYPGNDESASDLVEDEAPF